MERATPALPSPSNSLQILPARTHPRSSTPHPRELLILQYCPESIQATTRASRENEDCLIRLYAGKCRRITGYPPTFLNLRNYGLHIDQMLKLGLDVNKITEVLARTLAHCYWRAHVDANDVEFVLAPATHPISADTPNFTIAGTELVIWMLDFDCVRPMSQDIEGLQQAVKAFYQNDSYFLRPHFHGHTDDDMELWARFKGEFLDETIDIFDEQGDDSGTDRGCLIIELAEEWINEVEVEGKRRAYEDEGDFSCKYGMGKYVVEEDAGEE